jgi:hypothetical protein
LDDLSGAQIVAGLLNNTAGSGILAYAAKKEAMKAERKT